MTLSNWLPSILCQEESSTFDLTSRYNDATFLVGDNLHKLRKEPLEEKDQMYENCHQGLTDTRKKYDDMKKQRVKMDEAIYRLKVNFK